MGTCPSRAVVRGTETYDGTEVSCSVDYPHEVHVGPVRGSEQAGDGLPLQWQWDDAGALDGECGHTAAEHAEHDRALPAGLAGLLAAMGVRTEGVQVLGLPEPKPDATDALLARLAKAQDAHGKLLEAAAGHRTEAERQGFSPTMAEQMAAMFYMQVATGQDIGSS